MTPKAGILHDYDLMANAEGSARGNTCVTCDVSPVRYQWSDYSGEAMCTRCGTPYQLKWGSERQREGGEYPYLNLKPEWASAVREYWQETQRFACLGRMLGGRVPGAAEFFDWVKRNHPDLMADDS